jgi:hypothetical protein
VSKIKLGDRVQGLYLGHAVIGTVQDVSTSHGSGQTRYRIRLDEPVDVVKSTAFSSLRQNLTVTLDKEGYSINHKDARDDIAEFKVME